LEHDGSCDPDLIVLEVDVVPLETEKLAHPQPGPEGQEHKSALANTENSNESLNFACAKYHRNCFSLCTFVVRAVSANPTRSLRSQQTPPAPISEKPQSDRSRAALPEKPEPDQADEETEEPLGTYAPLARHLKNVPSATTWVVLTFDEIEKILKSELPRSAFQYRAWWSNDPTKPQSAAWLDEGWRTNAAKMTERRLAFVRTDDRERAYITFVGEPER
jgi:hypothetical protein